jgi:hypothetical protein
VTADARPGTSGASGHGRSARHDHHSGGARLTKTAASELDATVGTSLFKAGLELGTAGTLVKF